jgi:hypothetical protein
LLLFRRLPNLFSTVGGCLKSVLLVNILKSGLWSSLGGGGRFGTVLLRGKGVGRSGSRMSFVEEFLAKEFLDAVGDVGVDMLACMDGRGSLMMGEEEYDS